MANDLMIYGAIGWDVNALDSVRAISEAKGRPLNVRVNSPGGYVWEGLAIANAIKAHGNASTTVDALAASMGSVIFLAGKRRTMASGSRLMIHNPASVAVGESSEMRKEADILDSIASDMALMYSEATGGKVSVEEAQAMMDAETWLSPEQAVDLGFAHGIEGKRTAFAKIPETIQYRNAPKEVMQMSTENPEAPGLLDRMMAKLTGTESIKAELALAESALVDATARIASSEARATTAEAALAAAKAEHAAALESAVAAARIEGEQAATKALMQGGAPSPIPHVEESTEAFTTHTAKWDALRASGDYKAAGEYRRAHETAILEGK